ncbi:MAG: alpha-galactosidase [Lentisphaeria bacterium]|nr:alpha-galactosidase [Lentisphaeria bacterium]
MSFNILVTDRDGKILECFNRKISADMLRHCGGQLTVSAQIPAVEVTAIWHAALATLPEMKLPWNIEFSSGSSHGMPLLVFMDQNSSASYAVGLTNCIDDCMVSCKMNQELCCFEVKFVIAAVAGSEPFEIFADCSSREMTAVLQDFRQLVMTEIPEYPAGAWDAVYCSWYAVHTAITGKYLRKNAVEAHRLGFGTFIVDDGWCFDENKRVTPLTLPDWYRDIGDWQLSESKLPEMKQIIAEAQTLGMNYIFWVAPFFAGRRSKLNESVSKFLTELHEGQRIYDPADETAAEQTMANICRIFEEMDLDGLKIDFVDSVMPDAANPHCRVVKEYLEKLIGRVRKLKPSALIEFRQNYATPVNASLATAFRAGDVPFDYMQNFSSCIQLRLIMGDRIPVHADPVYFHPGESSAAVGRHMIASLAGVPMLSMELTGISPEHKAVIKNYLDFYNAHRETLNFGHWSLKLHNGFAAAAICNGADESIVILSDKSALTEALTACRKRVTVLNMCAGNLSVDGEIFDAAGNVYSGNDVPSGGRVELTAASEQ